MGWSRRTDATHFSLTHVECVASVLKEVRLFPEQDEVIEGFEHWVNLTSKRSDIRIQIQTDPRYQEFIRRASSKQVLGYKMKVATVEDVLRGKIWAYLDDTRRKSKRQKDLADIFRLVESHPRLKEKIPEEIRRLM